MVSTADITLNLSDLLDLANALLQKEFLSILLDLYEMSLYFRLRDDDGRVFRRDCDAAPHPWCHDGKNFKTS